MPERTSPQHSLCWDRQLARDDLCIYDSRRLPALHDALKKVEIVEVCIHEFHILTGEKVCLSCLFIFQKYLHFVEQKPRASQEVVSFVYEYPAQEMGEMDGAGEMHDMERFLF